jgi:solute carrier family 25 carnitine/acylcarnitine transporter 20/29
VGASYPLDSLKTKQQALALQGRQKTLTETVKFVLQDEGISGFYQGVVGIMFGQALIKSSAFASNQWALTSLQQLGVTSAAATTTAAGAAALASPTILQLMTAASFSGFVASFVCNPVERIKVLMQAGNTDEVGYSNEIDCLTKVVQEDGWWGLFSRGLSATLVREVPGYGFYFVAYSLALQTAFIQSLGSFAPLLGGALAGMAAWLPVYPADVVKTAMQNTKGTKNRGPRPTARQGAGAGGSESEGRQGSQGRGGSKEEGFIDVAVRLQQDQGWGVFVDGLTPKMLRASLNHAVTFFVYDAILAHFVV